MGPGRFDRPARGARSPSAGRGGVQKAGDRKKQRGKSSLKSQIRGCERLLAKADLEPKARIAQEAKLEKLRNEHNENLKAEKERKYALRYRRVKFFERVKAERHLNQLQRDLKQAVLEGNEQAAKELKAQLPPAEEQLTYVKHFPKDEKYVSLFKGEGEQMEAERKRLMQRILNRQRDLAIVTEADEGAGDLPAEASIEPEPVKEQEQPAAAIASRGSRRKRAQPEYPPPVGESAVETPEGEASQLVVKKGSRRKKAQPDPGTPQELKSASSATKKTKVAAAVPPETPYTDAGDGGGACAGSGKNKPPRSQHSTHRPQASASSAAAVVESDRFFMPGDDFFMSVEDADGGAEEAKALPLPSQTIAEQSRGSKDLGGRGRVDRGRPPHQDREGGGRGRGRGKWGSGGDRQGKRQSTKKEGSARPAAAPVHKPFKLSIPPVDRPHKPPAGEKAASHAEKGKQGASAAAKPKVPVRTRAEGGRKRRSKKKEK